MQRLVFVSLAAVVLLATVSTAAPAQAGRPGAPPPPPPPAPASAPATQQTATVPVARIAYVNLQEVLRRTPGYVAAESTYRKLVTGYQNELQRLQQQLDSAVQAFDQQSIALSPAARQAKQKDLQGMQQRMVQRQQALQDTAQAKEDELMEPLRNRINSIIQGIRAESNYSLIIDADAGGGFLLAADPALNITPRVLARLTQAQ
jgi:outer membrane protein